MEQKYILLRQLYIFLDVESGMEFQLLDNILSEI